MINILSSKFWLLAILVFTTATPGDVDNELSGGSGNVVITSEGQWEKLWDGPKLMVWQRWLRLNHDRDVRQRKCQMALHASLREVLALIGDHRRATQWMSMVDSVELLSQSGNTWYTLAHYNMPWPLRNKLLASRLHQTTLFDGHMAVVEVQSDNTRLKNRDDVNDFGSFHGKWVIVDLGNNLCFAEFTAFSTSTPLFPRWLQDPVVDRVFMNTMQQFSKIAQGGE